MQEAHRTGIALALRAAIVASLVVSLPACKGKKQEGGQPEAVGELVPTGEKVEIMEAPEGQEGTKLRPTADDFKKLFEPPPCPDPDSDDPLGGAFTLEQALEGIVKPDGAGNPKATIETNRAGGFTCELFADKAPKTVANFIGLARGLRDWWNPRTCQWVKKPYYDGLIFHRVIPEFMIQGGCPLGTGIGNPGYTFDDEIDPGLHQDKVGLLSMANAGKTPDGHGTNGSQFFILDQWNEKTGPPTRLDGKHTIFGICSPASLVFQIARTPSTGCVPDPLTGKCGKGSNRPLEDVAIKSVTIGY